MKYVNNCKYEHFLAKYPYNTRSIKSKVNPEIENTSRFTYEKLVNIK